MSEKDQESQEQIETPENEQEENPPVDNPFGLPDDHPAMKEIKKLRRSEAGMRVKKNDEAEQARKWREYVESQKTELERAKEAKAQLEKDLANLRTAQLRQDIADEYGLDADLRELLEGDEETMRKRAEKLSEKLKTSQTPKSPLDLHAGERGKPVKKESTKGGQFLLNLARDMNL